MMENRFVSVFSLPVFTVAGSAVMAGTARCIPTAGAVARAITIAVPSAGASPVTNTGAIAGAIACAVATAVSSTNASSVTNTGAIAGAVTRAIAIAVPSAGASSVTNTGAITGAIAHTITIAIPCTGNCGRRRRNGFLLHT